MAALYPCAQPARPGKMLGLMRRLEILLEGEDGSPWITLSLLL